MIIQPWKLKLDSQLVNLLKGIIKDWDNDYDAVIAVEGGYGSGKTTFSLEGASILYEPFEFRREMIPGMNNIAASRRLIQLIDELPQRRPIVVDEAQDVAHKQDWYSNISKIVNRRMGKARKKFKAVFLNISDINEFNRYFRNQRIDYYIEILARNKEKGIGVGVVWYKDRTYKRDAWRTEMKEKLLDKYFEGVDRATIGVNELLEAYRSMPNFGFEFYFPPLPTNIYEDYLAFLAEQPDESIDEMLSEEPGGSRWKRQREILGKLVTLIIEKNIMTQSQLSEFCGWSPGQINHLLREQKARPIDNLPQIPQSPLEDEGEPTLEG